MTGGDCMESAARVMGNAVLIWLLARPFVGVLNFNPVKLRLATTRSTPRSRVQSVLMTASPQWDQGVTIYCIAEGPGAAAARGVGRCARSELQEDLKKKRRPPGP